MNWSLSKSALHCGVACIALVCAPSAWAQAKPVDIPAEDAGKSIPELARQAGVQIIAPGQALHGVVTPALKGEYEVRVALTGMLKGTDLRIASDDGQTIVLAQNQKNVPAAANDVAANTPNTPNAPVEQIVVTGSRVISSIANSPTPLTVVTTEQLQSTTPTNIPDALNKLPVFSGSSQPRTAGNGGAGSGMNVLALRNFGAQRTLVLFDGHRVAPANANGTVDIDTLPQMLMSRVDVVTGGASAVYGSDAVTGVVNFILDKNFDGLKFNVNSGISNYGDGFSYKVAAAAGTDLFGGRGHFEMSIEHFNQDGVPIVDRPYGPQYWSQAGGGTAANPYVILENTRVPTHTFGGLITCSICSVNGEQFVANGVVGPFVHGTASGTANVESGGDGAYDPFGQAITYFRTNNAYGRFSYNVDDTTNFYVQASGSEAFASGTWYPTLLNPGANNTNTFFKSNPFLPASVQAALGNNGTNTVGGPNDNTFQLTKYIVQFGRQEAPGTRNLNRYLSVSTGLDGSLFGKYDWDIYYGHGESRQTISNVRNPNNQRFYAAEDAVPGPNGSVVCYVSTTQYASLYPGCVPLDPFGPTAVSQSAYDYISGTTRYIMTNIMDNVSGSLSGTLLDDWAGPVKVALSGEARWNTYDVNSNAQPTTKVDCTGLRLCSNQLVLWEQNTVASAHASNNVWEIAAEADVPLLKDLPLVQSFDANLAGRYTDYSTSGSVQTWKVGLDYHVNDEVRFRGTTSIDIRAPTLNDLFSPVQNSVTGFTDIHTNTNGSLFISSRGNRNLQPEVARTYTGGVVFTPNFIPNLTLSFDYYHIDLKNAIGSISATNTQIQNLCEQSGGTSPYCALFIRPLPFSNTTPANYPTSILSENLNTADTAIEGSDIEMDYHFDLADAISSWPGSVDMRVLANIQPVNLSQQFTSAAFTYAVMSKGHVTSFINYNIGDWTFGFEDRWISSFNRASQPTIIFAQPRIPASNYIDVNMERRFTIDGDTYSAYFTVQNLFNALAPLDPTTSGAPGIYYPVANGQSGGSDADIMGRYFTIGLRASL
ncbi:MAG TPA: TonB-dependent receptor [Rhizomicrobium sp.]|jgi:outer membrane cobalamin receptor